MVVNIRSGQIVRITDHWDAGRNSARCLGGLVPLRIVLLLDCKIQIKFNSTNVMKQRKNEMNLLLAYLAKEEDGGG